MKKLNVYSSWNLRLVQVAVIATCLFSASVARADLLEQMAINTRGISLGNAMTADPNSPMAVHYNPAALTQLRGKVLEMGLTVPDFTVKASFEKPSTYTGFFGYDDDPVAGTTTETKGLALNIPLNGPASLSTAVAPGTSLAYHPAGARWTAGIAIYAPLAGGFEWPDGPAVYGAQHLHLQRLVLAPGIGYKLTETLSVGASVGFGASAMGARVEMRAPNDLVALTGLLGDITRDLDDVLTLGLIPFPLFGGGLKPFDSIGRMTATNLQDNLTTSYNLGILWEPWEWISLGLCYQSETKAKMSGTFTLEYSQDFQNMMDWLVSNELMALFTKAFGLPTQGGLDFQRGRATVDFEFPRRIQAGIRLQPIKQVKLLCDVDWFEGSAMEYNIFKFDQDIQLLQLARLLGYQGGNQNLTLTRKAKDSVSWHFGVELMPFDWLTIRGGYQRRNTSVNMDYLDIMMPLPDINMYSGGLGIRITRDATVDIGVQVGKGEHLSSHYEDDTVSNNMNNREFTALIYNPYAGLNVDMDIDILIISAGLTYQF